MMSPLAWLATRVCLGPRSLHLATATSVAASVAIIVAGAVVRVTGSGLGCPEWPYCTESTLAPTAAMGIHGLIEFANRLLTGVLCVVVVWVILSARLQKAPSKYVLQGAWSQFWIVVLNAIVGGITVWARLSPWVVAAHFLAALLLLTAAVVTWDRANRPQQRLSGHHLPQGTRPAATALLSITAALVIIGTLVTGTGPHAGDSSNVERMPFDWFAVAAVHESLAVAALTVAIWFLFMERVAIHSQIRARGLVFVFILGAQGAVGIFQLMTDLNEVFVIIHLLGAALVWIGALRVWLESRESAGSREDQQVVKKADSRIS